MNGPSYFEIQADDVGRAKKFYQELFGWKFALDPALTIEYWRIETGGARGGLLKRPVPMPNGPSGINAFTCSMQVESFDEAAKKIVDMGGRVTMDKFAIPSVCWQGYFLDTERNTFGLFQSDAEAK